jgi:hypothetical protein
LILQVLTGAITAGQDAGLVTDGLPQAMARGLVLAAHGFVLSAHTMVDDDVDQSALDDELHALVSRSLAP